jgi:hypothetical protein
MLQVDINIWGLEYHFVNISVGFEIFPIEKSEVRGMPSRFGCCFYTCNDTRPLEEQVGLGAREKLSSLDNFRGGCKSSKVLRDETERKDFASLSV